MVDENRRGDPDHAAPCCPRCGATAVKPIVYGFVDVGAYLELGGRTPDFELGGLTPRAENRCCQTCGHRWVEVPAMKS